MDILQTITSTGGALQVVRAQIQTSHSSSRRAITSTTYSHYTNGTSTAAVASDVNSSMSSDLLVRLINKLIVLFAVCCMRMRSNIS